MRAEAATQTRATGSQGLLAAVEGTGPLLRQQAAEGEAQRRPTRRR